jgi:hypothetical protein
VSGPPKKIDAPEPPSFVPAQLVSEPSPPKVRKTLRFGIGSLFVCMTVFAFQFTMVRYCGALGAMALPPLIICFMILSAIYLEVRWKGSGNRQRRESLSNMLTNRSFLYILVLGVSAYGLGSVTSCYKFGPKSSSKSDVETIKSELETDLGFRCHRTHVRNQDRHQELLEIDSIDGGGAMNQAGLQKGDLVVSKSSVDVLLNQLHEQRGNTIHLTIQRGQSAFQRRLDEKEQFPVPIRIPERLSQ